MSDRRRLPVAVTAAGLAVAIVASAWVVVTSAFFDIQKIDVRGNRRLSDRQIVGLSGARLGSNLITLSLDRIRRSLMGSPWIASADAIRSLPSTLVIDVRERSAVAWVRDPGGYAALAGDGVVVERGTDTPQGLVALGTAGSSTPVGERSRGLGVPLRVVASLDTSIRRMVEEARLAGNEVELLLTGGARVLYGTAESLRAKNAALASMLRYARRNQLEVDYLDVRSPAAPALKPV
jgi:cell division protein FtsQ